MRVLCELAITTSEGEKGTVTFPANLRLPNLDVTTKKTERQPLDIYLINGLTIKFN